MFWEVGYRWVPAAPTPCPTPPHGTPALTTHHQPTSHPYNIPITPIQPVRVSKTSYLNLAREDTKVRSAVL
ncbi:hypothetical protein E2C01_011697 [Portunus trituberculatus]|uniref:Uncharacterized protein n=1 Tax=Portunus trituberculatus TaxID=210409 RepID=A0A5B7DBY9_PORTR|nr:hypothetical protein [Portunus trituberculatus]